MTEGEAPGADQVDRVNAAITELQEALLEKLGDNPQNRFALSALFGQLKATIDLLAGVRTSVSEAGPTLLE